MKNKPVALVTGASSGIGAAIAQRLARSHRVFGTTRNPVALFPDGVEKVSLDVGADESVQKCVRHVVDAAGSLDVLVNNAGYLLAGGVEEATIAEAKAQFETNLFGVVRMVKAVLPIMRKQRAGHILTVSSIAGRVPVPFWGYYNASKFAVEGLIETLRYEVRPFGIRVSLIEPGVIKTPFYAHPPTASMPEYSVWRERALNAMKRFEDRAPGPDIVAARVETVVAQRNPSLRNIVTRDATLFSFLRWILPARWNEMGVRKSFKLD